jgi:hypothetical protein
MNFVSYSTPPSRTIHSYVLLPLECPYSRNRDWYQLFECCPTRKHLCRGYILEFIERRGKFQAYTPRHQPFTTLRLSDRSCGCSYDTEDSQCSTVARSLIDSNCWPWSTQSCWPAWPPAANPVPPTRAGPSSLAT